MTRILALLIIALLVYLALSQLLRSMRRSLFGRQVEMLWGALRQERGEGREKENLLELVRCRSCGVHVPRSVVERRPEGHLCERCRARARTA